MSIVPDRRTAVAKQWAKRQFPTLLTAALFVVLWEAIARIIGDNRIVADISYTGRSLLTEVDTVAVRVTETFSSVVIAFVLAVLLGVSLGLVVAEVFTIRQMTMPLIIFAYAVPHPVLAPMFIIWFLVAR
jgi:NitT/TauT family transport system permease protein